MSENFLDYFICPYCGSKDLVEQQSMANVEAGIENLHYNAEGDLIVEYEYIETEDGEIEHFRCAHCNEEILGEDGEFITDYDELVDWIKAGCKEHNPKETYDKTSLDHGIEDDEVDEVFNIDDYTLSPERIINCMNRL